MIPRPRGCHSYHGGRLADPKERKAAGFDDGSNFNNRVAMHYMCAIKAGAESVSDLRKRKDVTSKDLLDIAKKLKAEEARKITYLELGNELCLQGQST